MYIQLNEYRITKEILDKNKLIGGIRKPLYLFLQELIALQK